MFGADILRYNAFAAAPEGGNPAGVVLNAQGLNDAQMQIIATEVGYSETAFVTSAPEAAPTDEVPAQLTVRYFSPSAEVPFCGHATVATAIALAERIGTGGYNIHTPSGEIMVHTSDGTGELSASFTSVPPQIREIHPDVLSRLLDMLGLSASDIDPRYPPQQVHAGNWHPIIVLRDRTVFDQFRFHPPSVAALMHDQGWHGTVTILYPLGLHRFQARNLFVSGRITEDPATGSAAASTGAYLRELGTVKLPAEILIDQGQHVARPSLLTVQIPVSGGIIVTGTALAISDKE